MRIQGSITLLSLLIILAALCNTGFSLTCFSCFNSTDICLNTSTCTPNLDVCFVGVAAKRFYRGCWRAVSCNQDFFTERLDVPEMTFRCCSEDKCNKIIEDDSGTAALSGMTVLLVAPFLAAVWYLCS
ncbi:PREDICTED: CD59 glycoprotein [Chinchilla lanigera]|uniref:MAC-inhibitory protein n=1 Tax=Chinchilla lanigera TaxID=34839 RepID=A0A8C2VY68_CHILA|nr:PREDICTED: CD59 glycoprotein [Chinchilla lanigera]